MFAIISLLSLLGNAAALQTWQLNLRRAQSLYGSYYVQTNVPENVEYDVSGDSFSARQVLTGDFYHTEWLSTWTAVEYEGASPSSPFLLYVDNPINCFVEVHLTSKTNCSVFFSCFDAHLIAS